MHICLVGGIKRKLARSVERADLVVIAIEINSHGGARQAKELALKKGRPFVRIRKPSVSALERLFRSSQCAATGTEG